MSSRKKSTFVFHFPSFVTTFSQRLFVEPNIFAVLIKVYMKTVARDFSKRRGGFQSSLVRADEEGVHSSDYKDKASQGDRERLI